MASPLNSDVQDQTISASQCRSGLEADRGMTGSEQVSHLEVKLKGRSLGAICPTLSNYARKNVISTFSINFHIF